MKTIEILPLPVSGTMLGIMSLGNLLSEYAKVPKVVCTVVSSFILTLIVLKMVIFPKIFWNEMKNPVAASVAGTFSMTIMLLAVDLKKNTAWGADLVWYTGVCMQLLIILYFSKKHLYMCKLKDVYASYLVNYSGLAMFSITAVKMGYGILAKITFWIALFVIVCLLVLILYRYWRIKEVQKEYYPLFFVLAAPINLCLISYIESFSSKSNILIGILSSSGICLFLIVLTKLPRIISKGFFPSYSALTFPSVVVGLALRTTVNYCWKKGYNPVVLGLCGNLVMVFAVGIVCYTCFSYFCYIFCNLDV